MWPDFTNPWNHSIDRGLSDFHRAQRFVTSGLWQLPRLAGQSPAAKALAGGWSVAGVLTLLTDRMDSAVMDAAGPGLRPALLDGDQPAPALCSYLQALWRSPGFTLKHWRRMLYAAAVLLGGRPLAEPFDRRRMNTH